MSTRYYPDMQPSRLVMLPCPFCGQSTAEVEQRSEHLFRLSHLCPVVGTIDLGWKGSLSELILTWNTRADNKPL